MRYRVGSKLDFKSICMLSICMFIYTASIVLLLWCSLIPLELYEVGVKNIIDYEIERFLFLTRAY
jgi:hypothetical protein